jgi:hypothetical protein
MKAIKVRRQKVGNYERFTYSVKGSGRILTISDIKSLKGDFIFIYSKRLSKDQELTSLERFWNIREINYQRPNKKK